MIEVVIIATSRTTAGLHAECGQALHDLDVTMGELFSRRNSCGFADHALMFRWK